MGIRKAKFFWLYEKCLVRGEIPLTFLTIRMSPKVLLLFYLEEASPLLFEVRIVLFGIHTMC